MSTFICWDPDVGEMFGEQTIEAEHPTAAAEETLRLLVSLSYDLPDEVEVLVQDQAERRYLVTVVFLHHPSEWGGLPRRWWSLASDEREVGSVTEPNPMDPERLALLRERVSSLMGNPGLSGLVDRVSPAASAETLSDLLADRDHQENRAVGAERDRDSAAAGLAELRAELERASRALIEEQQSARHYAREWASAAAKLAMVECERDELLRAAANIGVEMLDDTNGEFGPFGSAGAITRSAASLMVAAVRMHGSKVETGIVCEVDVDGRLMEVIAQWADAPARTNAVGFAASFFKEVTRVAALTGVPRGDCEQPFAWLERAQADLKAEAARLRARARVEAQDVEEKGVTLGHVRAWLHANGWGTPTEDQYGWVSAESETGGEPVDLWRTDGSTPLDLTIRFIADDIGRPSMVVLDEMAAMPLDTEARDG